METMDQLTYTSDLIPESVRDAADNAAAQCRFGRFEEVLLGYINYRHTKHFLSLGHGSLYPMASAALLVFAG